MLKKIPDDLHQSDDLKATWNDEHHCLSAIIQFN
jgi:hypothetical protein